LVWGYSLWHKDSVSECLPGGDLIPSLYWRYGLSHLPDTFQEVCEIGEAQWLNPLLFGVYISKILGLGGSSISIVMWNNLIILNLLCTCFDVIYSFKLGLCLSGFFAD
jgi:hypothetical protein